MLTSGHATARRARVRSLGAVAAVALAAAAAVVGVDAAPARAETTCPEGQALNPQTMKCSTTARDTVTVPGAQPVGTGSGKCRYKGLEFDCNNGDGARWSPSLQCWAIPWDPQPAADDPLWEGRTDGMIVSCHNPECFLRGDGTVSTVSLGQCSVRQEWVPAWEGVTPYVLALQAVSDMDLRAPQIGMTGGSPPDGMQIIGIPAWMWAADPGEATTGPVTRSATAGSVTVTATGRLDRTTWSMGDGATVTCEGENAKGTPYEGRYDKLPSPTCGHTYTRTSGNQPGQVYNVTVTAHWTITWSGGGQSGTITQEVTRTTQRQVGELQALIVGPGDRT